MSYDCPKCGGSGVETKEDQNDPNYWDYDVTGIDVDPDKCYKCGWKYEPRWHDNPNLPSENTIVVCIVLIFLFYVFW
jgi:hypothetical protein